MNNDVNIALSGKSTVEQSVVVEDFDPERRRLADSYKKKTKKIDRMLLIVNSLVMVVIVVSKVSVYLEKVIKEFVANEFMVVFVFYTISFIILSVIEFIIAYFINYKINLKYGLIKLTKKAWIFRFIKSSLISFFITLIPLEIIYAFLRSYPSHWWFFSSLLIVFFYLVIAIVFPLFLFPLFYKTIPLKDNHPDLEHSLRNMLKDEGLRKIPIYEWLLGKVSSAGNAGLMGLGPTRRVIISDTMLKRFTHQEIEFVIAHELGHHKHRDSIKGFVFGLLNIIVVFYCSDLIYKILAQILGYPSIEHVSGLPLLLFCFFVIQLFLSVINSSFSRYNERKADDFAIKKVPYPEIAKSVFIKLADQNLEYLYPSWWEKYLFMSHPPVLDRISRVMNFSNEKEQ